MRMIIHILNKSTFHISVTHFFMLCLSSVSEDKSPSLQCAVINVSKEIFLIPKIVLAPHPLISTPDSKALYFSESTASVQSYNSLFSEVPKD